MSGHRAAGATFALLLMTASPAQLSRAAEYLGAQGCMPCHESIHAAWQKTRHANAMESLVSAGQPEGMGCLPCHVTGYGELMGYLDMNATPELAGVQCEACHGPAKDHALAQGKVATKAQRPGPDLCRQCHTPEQDSAFDYDNMSKKVH